MSGNVKLFCQTCLYNLKKILFYIFLQVTTYSHKDENNLWKIKPADRDASSEESPPIIVKSGDLVRLEHIV